MRAGQLHKKPRLLVPFSAPLRHFSKVKVGVVTGAVANAERRVIRIWCTKGRRVPKRSIAIERSLTLCFHTAGIQACRGPSLYAVHRFCESRHAATSATAASFDLLRCMTPSFLAAMRQRLAL
jgi:hypothetical protein